MWLQRWTRYKSFPKQFIVYQERSKVNGRDGRDINKQVVTIQGVKAESSARKEDMRKRPQRTLSCEGWDLSSLKVLWKIYVHLS